MNDNINDITIIGAGPVGLFTAFYGGLRDADVHIIESLPHIGGQLTALYPENIFMMWQVFRKFELKSLSIIYMIR